MIYIIIAVLVGLILGGIFTDIVDRIDYKLNGNDLEKVINEIENEETL